MTKGDVRGWNMSSSVARCRSLWRITAHNTESATLRAESNAKRRNTTSSVANALAARHNRNLLRVETSSWLAARAFASWLIKLVLQSLLPPLQGTQTFRYLRRSDLDPSKLQPQPWCKDLHFAASVDDMERHISSIPMPKMPVRPRAAISPPMMSFVEDDDNGYRQRNWPALNQNPPIRPTPQVESLWGPGAPIMTNQI